MIRKDEIVPQLCTHPACQDTQDPNPLIRALAVRTMGCIRVDKITEYLCDPLQRCLKVRCLGWIVAWEARMDLPRHCDSSSVMTLNASDFVACSQDRQRRLAHARLHGDACLFFRNAHLAKEHDTHHAGRWE